MSLPELRLTGPDSIVASIPYIIGFTPIDSLVVMWLTDDRVRLTMRLDLPPGEAVPPGYIETVIAHHGMSDEAIACIVISPQADSRSESGDLRGAELITALLEGLDGLDCRVRDALLVSGNRWWSYLCTEAECCSPSGTPLDATVAHDVAARFVLAGVSRLPDRDAVVATCAPDARAQQAVRGRLVEERRSLVKRLAEAGQPAEELEDWRDESISQLRDFLLDNSAPSAGHEAAVLLGLCDTRIRDTVLWEVAHSQEHDPHRAFDRAVLLLRQAPAGVVAPIGAVTGVLAWLIGDGVRAIAALDRVEAEMPDYALAELLRTSIEAGLTPASWLAMMHSLPRAACRGGHVLAVGEPGA